MYRSLGRLDAVVCAAGQARFAPLAELSDADFRFSLDNKLLGGVNVVRFGFEHMEDGGSFTLTTGTVAQRPIQGGAAISRVNAGLEGPVRAAWVTETLQALKMDTSQGQSAAVMARAYVRSVTGTETGSTLEPVQWP